MHEVIRDLVSSNVVSGIRIQNYGARMPRGINISWAKIIQEQCVT